MTIDVSLIPQNRVENLISKLSEIENNIGNIGTDITNNVVHKTGNETINGTKTFTSTIFAQGDITLGTSTNTWGKMVQFRDTTGKRIARIQTMAVTTTNNRVGMWVNNADNSVERGIYVDSDGTTYAPHPATAQDSSNRIATTAWVNNLDNSVVHKAGDETITGTKTFSGNTNDSLKMIISNTSGQNCRLQLRDSTTTYGDSGIEIFQATSNNFNQFLIHFMNGNKYPFHIDQDTSDSSIFNTYINNKRLASFVTTTYQSGTSWYRIWNDGYIEQGGITNYMSWTGNGATVNITFLKPMSNTNYHRGATMLDYTSSWNTPGCCVNSCNTSGMVVGVATLGNNQGTTRCSWYACGY